MQATYTHVQVCINDHFESFKSEEFYTKKQNASLSAEHLKAQNYVFLNQILAHSNILTILQTDNKRIKLQLVLGI